jgi:hypothetical protein
MYGKRKTWVVMVVNSEGKRKLVKSVCRWKDNIMTGTMLI